MNIQEARSILKANRCGLSTSRKQSGRIACLSHASDLQKSVTNAIEKNNLEVIAAFKVYVETELLEIVPAYDIALRRYSNSTPRTRDAKLKGQKYNNLVDRLSLFESLSRNLNASK